jgi:hypothetical protein
MRPFVTLALCAIALALASCNDTPTGTSTNYGKTTLDEFLKNTAYAAWYQTGYEAYPMAEGKTSFDSFVSTIKSSFDPSQHTVVMVVKPNCGCQTTQTWMPKIMKTLDAAGVPHDNVVIYVTDANLTGVDQDAKTKYSITTAPAFIVVKGTQVEGSILPSLVANQPPVEADLASFFTK